jgi:iron complex outermembrane receptor protein
MGFRYLVDDSKAAPALGFDPPSTRQENASAFVQDRISLSDRTRLTIGTKLEHTEYTGFEIEPSVRLQHELNSSGMVWSAISRAVRTPSRIDRALRQPSAGPAVLMGNPNFESESVVAYEAGFRGQIARRLVGSVAAFYNDYRDIRSVAFTPGSLFPLVVGNDLEGESHGAELTFNAEVTPNFRLNGGYTYLQTDLRIRPGGSDVNNALNETADPEHQFSLGSSIDLARGIELDAHLRWVDTLVINNGGFPATVPSYTELDLRLSVQISANVELSIVGRNLLDDHHPEIGAPGTTRVEIRRSVFAKVALRY